MMNFNCTYCNTKLYIGDFQYKKLKKYFCNNVCSTAYKKQFSKKGKNHPLYKKISVKCSNCNENIERLPGDVNNKKNVYCNKHCMFEHRKKINFYIKENNGNWKGGKIETQCYICKKVIFKKQYAMNASTKHFCSLKCNGINIHINLTGENNPIYNKKEYKCDYCNKSMMLSKSLINGNNRFCNRVCFGKYFSKHYSKENHWNWQDGKSFELYPEEFNKELKTEIRKRDKFTCCMCNKNGHIVHHIDCNKNNCNENNLITLCSKCHAKTHHYINYWLPKEKFINA